MNQKYSYDVALSFAGEDRHLAEELDGALRQLGLRVFYDRNEEADLWGKNLFEHLADIYENKARLCIMLVSEAYKRKAWPRHEMRSAQARALREEGEYILPLKIGDVDIPGILSTLAYISLADRSTTEIAGLVATKLSGSAPAPQGQTLPTTLEQLPVPSGRATLALGNLKLDFRFVTGDVEEIRGEREPQEMWIATVNGDEAVIAVPDHLLRARKGHFVSAMIVAEGQAVPAEVLAAMNYSTRTCRIGATETKYLAAAAVGGPNQVIRTLRTAGKITILRPFGFALLAIFLAVFLTDATADSVWIHVLFWAVLIVTFVFPLLQGGLITLNERKLEEFAANQYGMLPPDS